MNQLAREHEAKLKVLAVAVKDQRDKLNAFAAKTHPAYTILDGGLLQAQPALSYGAGNLKGGGSVPLNVLVRPNGTIAYVEGGFEAPSPLENDVNSFVSGSAEIVR